MTVPAKRNPRFADAQPVRENGVLVGHRCPRCGSLHRFEGQKADVRESAPTGDRPRSFREATPAPPPPPRQRMAPQAARDALMKEAGYLTERTGRSLDAAYLAVAEARPDLVEDGDVQEGVDAIRRRYRLGGHHAPGCSCLDCSRTATNA